MTVGMGSKTGLPALETVQKWTTQDLAEWLKQCNLSECIPTFHERNIDGATLLGMPNDKIITELSELKIKQRMQVAKCVTECKTQAAEAKKQLTKCVSECKIQASTCKKAVSSLKRSSKKKRAQVAAGSAGEPDDFDSGDGWSSDEFDTDDEEEEDRDYSNTINEDGLSASDFASDNLSTNGPGSVASSDSSGQYNDVSLELRPTMPGRTGVWNVTAPSTGRELDTSTPEPNVVLKSMSPLHGDAPPTASPKPNRSPIPKPPAASPHELSKLNSSAPRRSGVRLQRPPSQPPAPPVPSPNKSKSEPETPTSEDDCWQNYEIPNSGIPPGAGPAMIRVLPATPFRPALTNGHHWKSPDRNYKDESQNDTYEPIDQPEETYEAIDNPQDSPTSTPCLPPRKPASLPPHLLVPPLPEKPSKMVVQPQVTPIQVDNTVALPSKGASSSSPMSKVVNIFKSRLHTRRDSNASSKDAEVSHEGYSTAQSPPLTLPGSVTVTVNGTWPPNATGVPPPPPLPHFGYGLAFRSSQVNTSSPSRHPSQGNISNTSDENISMTLRPLPPVPPSQNKFEGKLDCLPYYMDIERDEAEQRLLSLQDDDVYLVRPSRRGGKANPHTLTLIHNRRPFHLNIRIRPDGQFALGRKKDNEMVFPSVSALVTHHQHHPIYLSALGENVGTSLLRRHP